ncbi:hypothetical protein BH11MYX1_BH11MYX1_42690 [soil metagenome]
MQKLALGAFVGFLVACGGGSDSKIHIVDSAGSGSGSDNACNPLTQTGCNTGEMCTWIYDLVSADGTNILGHVGCAPDGDKAVSASCTRNAAGAQGWDDCAKGGFCRVRRELVAPGGVGVCEAICDNNGGTPGCGSDAACVGYHGIFDPGDVNVAGVCDLKCDPFADNDFNHQGSAAPVRPGTKCQAYEGCYGGPRATANVPTSFSCAREYNTDLHNRDACTATSGNSLTSSNPLTRVACSTASNGCSEGYMPILIENTGSMTAVCTAMCKPANCYMGSCGGSTQSTTNLLGQPGSGHTCADRISNPSSFTLAIPGAGSGATNGTGCTFNWVFEIDMAGMYYPSPFSDTVGWCRQHDQYVYDSNNDAMLTNTDDPVPKCDTIATQGYGTHTLTDGKCTAANGCRGAADFGCVSKAVAGPAPAFQAVQPLLMSQPQSPNGVRMAQ